MAEYSSRLGTSSGFSIAAEPEESLVGALKQRYKQPGSPILKILSTLQIPEQVIASMIRESVEQGERPYKTKLSATQSALRGIAEPETSYGDIPGVGTKAGIAMDIVLDPMWVAGAPLGKAAMGGVKSVGGQVSRQLAKHPALDYAATRVMTKVSPHYAKTRAGYKGFEEQVEIPARVAEGEVIYQLVNKAAQDFHKLVPNPQRKLRVLEVAEMIPRGVSEATIGKRPGLMGLSASEQKAVQLVREKGRAIEEIRTTKGVLPEETAEAFNERTRLFYLQRIFAPREAIVNDMNDRIARYGSKWSAKDLERVTQTRDAIKNMDDMPNEAYLREMQNLYRHGRRGGMTPGFTKKRKIGESIQELGKSEEARDAIAWSMLEKDAARVLHQSSAQTARAVYRKVYLGKFIEYAHKNGALFKKEQIVDLPPQFHGRGDRALTEIKDIPELEGYFAPRVLAQNLKEMLMSPLDPEKVRNSVGLWRRANAWWRAWALAAPMTLSRNAMDSVIWRNAAAGMRPDDYGHIVRAMQIVKGARNGTLEAADKALYKEMVSHGVMRSNMFEETRHMLGYGAQHNNVVAKFLDPQTSKPVQTFFDYFGGVEDVARGGLYLWQKSKGASNVEALKLVNKWHIDYRYGLTPFLRKVRDNAVPFITFTRFNIPLALETLISQPHLVAAGGHAIDTVEDVFGGEEIPLGGWMASGTPMRLHYDKDSGQYQILMLDGLWSLTDINKTIPGRALDTLADMLTPLGVAPYEVIKNHHIEDTGWLIERPGDKLELFGKKLDIPFGKRIEHVLRVFRPINEADKIIEMASSKYGDTNIQRGANALGRALFGRTYPTTREAQVKLIAHSTDEQLRSIRTAMKRAKAENDTKTYEELVEKEAGLKSARKEMGIK